jgi:LysR family transcriptional regulator for metE and metH
LFDRTSGRRLQPTEAGTVIQQAAIRAMSELQRCEEDVLRSAGRFTDTVRIAVGTYDSYHWYASFLRRVRLLHPTIDVQLVIMGDEPARSLDAREVDVVIAPGEPRGLFTSIPLFDDELVVMVAPTHPFAGRESVEAHELVDETYLTYSRIAAPGFEYERFLSLAEVSPRVVTVVEQVGAIAELVAADAGFSVLSRWAMTSMIDAGRIAPVRCGAEGLALQWNALMRSQEPVGSATFEVANMLVQHLP